MTPRIEDDCPHGVTTITYRALACEIRHRFLAENKATSIIAVDGYSGSGTSYFARRLAIELGAALLNTDDFVPGWDGLEVSIDLLEEWILKPVSRGEPARWQRFDWDLMHTAEWVDVESSSVLIVEGSGVGAKQLAEYYSYLVWVNVDESLRLDHLPRRFDGEMHRPFVEAWTRQERALRIGDDVVARADLVVENGRGAERLDGRATFLQRAS